MIKCSVSLMTSAKEGQPYSQGRALFTSIVQMEVVLHIALCACKVAMLQCYNVTMLQSCNVLMFQCCKFAMLLQCCCKLSCKVAKLQCRNSNITSNIVSNNVSNMASNIAIANYITDRQTHPPTDRQVGF